MNKIVRLGDLKPVVKKTNRTRFKIEDLNTGINEVRDYFVFLHKSKDITIYSKICDHQGGRLIRNGDRATCPMHGWSLDLRNGNYNNSNISKKPEPYTVEGDDVILKPTEKKLTNPFKQQVNPELSVKVSWLNHATILVEFNGVSIILDPWLFGPAFLTGWWLEGPSSKASVEKLKSADFVFISHNHPDHLHAETLALVDREKPIFTTRFSSRSSELRLARLGFRNIISIEPGVVYEIGNTIQIAALKSGDFRDDSGLYLSANGLEFLFTVDSNYLNFGVLPEKIDLLATSFASGASGFPVCYKNFSLSEIERIRNRNKLAYLAHVKDYLEKTKPRFYLPYAGMFAERADRDSTVFEINNKNTIEDMKEVSDRHGVSFLEPNKKHRYEFRGYELGVVKEEEEFLTPEDCGFYIDKLKEEFVFDWEAVIDHFSSSNFKGKQILRIIPTNDSFKPIFNNHLFVDFELGDCHLSADKPLLDPNKNKRQMLFYVRAEVLMAYVIEKLPIEDITIGFQARIERWPNEYEMDFWNYFTNNMSGSEHFRHSSLCGSCTVIEQNPIWL